MAAPTPRVPYTATTELSSDAASEQTLVNPTKPPQMGRPEDPSSRSARSPDDLITVPIKVPKQRPGETSEKKGMLSSIKSKLSSSPDYTLKSVTMTRANYDAHYRHDESGNYIGTSTQGYDGSEVAVSDAEAKTRLGIESDPNKSMRNKLLDGEGVVPATVTNFVGKKLEERDARKEAGERVVRGEEREGDGSVAVEGHGRMGERVRKETEVQGEYSSKAL